MRNLSFLHLKQLAFLVTSFLIIYCYVPIGGTLDLYLIQPYMSQHGEFPLKESWALAVLNHDYIKHIIVAIYAYVFIVWGLSFKFEYLKKYRKNYAHFFFVSMLCTLFIGFLKSKSAYACPWDMTIATTTGFDWNFSSTNGHCFPGGHASSGFALMTGYFVYLKNQPKRAYFYLNAGFILGFAMGWAQMMRGAHFLSHNLWSAWIVLFINYIILIFLNIYDLRKMKHCT